MDDSLEAKVTRLARVSESLARRHTALQVMILARLDALQAAVVSGLSQLGVQSPRQSMEAAIQNAARGAAESQLAAFADSDPTMASELRACITRYLDDDTEEAPKQ